MSKRMNKERAIEQIKKLIEFTKKTRKVIGTPQKDIEIVIGENQFYLSDELLQALDIAIESLENEWVDVRDRLPSESGYYLISIKGVRETTTWFYGVSRYGNGWDEFEGHEDIIAWKPLPQPYERKE